MIVEDPDLLEYVRTRPNCEWCGGSAPTGCDPHHAIIRCGIGGGSRLDVLHNLMAVHRLCHQEIEALGDKGKQRCLEIISARTGFPVEQIEPALWKLLRSPRPYFCCKQAKLTAPKKKVKV